jgi:soluble lytic murein transglycosylase-like protein
LEDRVGRVADQLEKDKPSSDTRPTSLEERVGHVADTIEKAKPAPATEKQPYSFTQAIEEEFPKLRAPLRVGGALWTVAEAADPTGTVRAAREYGTGAGKGLLSTTAHAGDVVAGWFGQPRVLDRPKVREMITPQGLSEQAGFAGEQIGEFFLPGEKLVLVPAAKGIELASKLRALPAVKTLTPQRLETLGRLFSEVVGPNGRELLAHMLAGGAKAGAVGGAQTGTWEGALWSALLGAAGPLVKPGATKVAGSLGETIYEQELKFPSRMGRARREEAVQRGLALPEELSPREQPGALPISERSLPRIQEEIDRNKAEIERLTQDPKSPYSQRSIEIDDVLRPLDRYIARVGRGDKALGQRLARMRLGWARELGYEPPAAAHTVETGLFDREGHPVLREVPRKPAKTTTTVARVQKLKEDLNAILPETAYLETPSEAVTTTGKKLARSGMRRAVETAVPEEAIGEINDVIRNDINLKKAMEAAINRRPSWLKDWGTFVLAGDLGAEAARRFITEIPATAHGYAKGGEAAIAIAAMARIAARSPGAMSRLAIALKRVGVLAPELLPAAGSLVRPEEPPSPRNQSAPSPSKPRAGLAPDLGRTLTQAAERQQLPPALLHTVARIESSGRPEAVSPKGAVGIMQMMPATARQYGARDVHDVTENINAAARLLRHLWRKYDGDVRLVLAAYNSGEGAVDRAGRRVPNIAETRSYVQRGMNLLSGRTAS